MDSGDHVNALEVLVDRVRQLEAHMAFVSMTVALLSEGNVGEDPVRDRARDVLELRAAFHDVRTLIDSFAPDRR